MKRIFLYSFILFSDTIAFAQQKEEVKDSFFTLSPVSIKAIRAGENAPFTKTNLTQKEISKNNLGQDLPFLLNQTPSVVVNSDAGNGIGYTGIRIRGTDATRINVTLNGIPYNDAESQGTFFVDLPDFSSSVGSIQIQRGVGTSSNGAGAFGASINLSTNELHKDAYLEVNNSYGSFQSLKNTIKAGTGLVKGFSTDIRLSNINSKGFIDRASSSLQSLYFTTAYTSTSTSLRFNLFTGKEKTYQAWYGISESDLLAGNRTINYAGTEKPGEPYTNETDNYKQTHYQLFFDQVINKKTTFQTALFFTNGNGYYEQYKAGEAYADYNFPFPINGTDTIFQTDLIRQLWLDNNYYGSVFSVQYKADKTSFIIGGAATRYDGHHFGKIVWAEKGITSLKNWYDNDAMKTDFNLYVKQQTKIANNWHLFYDLQYRHVNYDINGFRNNPILVTTNKFNFFNPKAGVSYSKNGMRSYFSYSIANKEPNRDDFEAGILQQPKPEQLHDIEMGVEKIKQRYNWSATFYYMNYKNQLVLTGKINDVGAYTRTNIANSYRAGLELQGAFQVNEWFTTSANVTLSKNKVKNFEEYIDDYDNGGQKIISYAMSDIAYSPSLVGSAALNLVPLKNTELSLISKYVGKQFLDNTSNENRQLDAFYVQDIRAVYTIQKKGLKEINLIAQVSNLFNTNYEPNGYTYSYISGSATTTENYYFPMAGTNFMIGLNIRL